MLVGRVETNFDPGREEFSFLVVVVPHILATGDIFMNAAGRLPGRLAGHLKPLTGQ